MGHMALRLPGWADCGNPAASSPWKISNLLTDVYFWFTSAWPIMQTKQGNLRASVT